MSENRINPIYQIPTQYEAYPKELNFADSYEEASKAISEQLIAVSSNANVQRLLDESEIEELRSEYTQIIEVDKCAVETILCELREEEDDLKERIKRQRDILEGLNTRVRDRVAAIKRGIADETLDKDKSIRIAVDERYLHYTHTENGMYVLAKVEDIPSQEQGDLFNSQTKNQEVFISLFGCNFTPSDKFEQIKLSKKDSKRIVGRQLATCAYRVTKTDYIDEDTGEVMSLDNKEVILNRDTVLTEEDIKQLFAYDVTEVILYKLIPNSDGEAKS